MNAQRSEAPKVPTTNAALQAACGFLQDAQRRGDKDVVHHWAWRITRILIARAMG